MATGGGSHRPRLDSLRSATSSVAGSQWGARPPSPTMSHTTVGADFSQPPHLIISRSDLRKSIQSLEDLMVQAKLYRSSLLAFAKCTSSFASALENCSRQRGCDTANAGILGASGIEHMIGNLESIMADTFYRNFEIPLLEVLDNYKASVTDRQVTYEKACHEKSTMIRKTELENMKHGRKKKRDLQQFRVALFKLQTQVEELEAVKSNYHQEVLEAEDELWNVVLAKVAFVIRAQMDLYERVASKSTDSALEPLMASNPDPFDSYGPPATEGIFSVLSPLGLMNSTPKAPTPSVSLPKAPGPKTPSALTPQHTATPNNTTGLAPDETSPVEAAPPSSTSHGLFGFPSGSSDVDDGEASSDTVRERNERNRRELSVIEDKSEIGSQAEVDDGNVHSGSHDSEHDVGGPWSTVDADHVESAELSPKVNGDDVSGVGTAERKSREEEGSKASVEAVEVA